MIKLLRVLLLVISVFIASCNQDNKLANVPQVAIDYRFVRFEQALFGLDMDHYADSLPFLRNQHPSFFDMFSHRIILIGGMEDPHFSTYLTQFVTDKDIYLSYQASQEVFDNMNPLSDKLKNALQRYKYHFPEIHIPYVYTFISGFNISIAVDDSVLAIGLDKYLGSESEFYKRLALPLYKRQWMNPSKIVPDAVTGLLMTDFPFEERDHKLVDAMIYYGKLYYITQQFAPEEPLYEILGIAEGKMTWCEENEGKMWTYLAEKKLLFTDDFFTIRKFTGEAPFTKDFTNDSPGRAVVWIGYQIVKKYMDKTQVTLSELMKEEDVQKILKMSRYNPS